MCLRRTLPFLLLAHGLVVAKGQCDQLVIAEVVPADTSICRGDSVALEVDGVFPPGTDIQWQELVADVWSDLLNDTDSVFLAVPTDTTFYRVVVSCSAEADTSDSVRVSVRPLPSSTNSGSAESCGSGTDPIFFYFTGTSPWNVWLSTSDEPFVSSLPEDTFAIASPAAGYYVLDSLTSDGCTGTDLGDTLFVSVLEPPDAVIISTDTTICSGGSAFLVSNDPGNGSGAWTINGSPDPQITVTSPTAATFAPLTAGEHVIHWTIAAPGCPADSDSVMVTVIGLAGTADAGTDLSICAGTSISLSGSDPAPGTGVWSIVSAPVGAPDPIADITDPHSAFSPGMSGQYTLRWTVSNDPCATSMDDMTIDVLETTATPMIIDFGADGACDGEYQTLAIGNPISGTTCSWSCPAWEDPMLIGDTITAHWVYPTGSTGVVNVDVHIVASGSCPDTTVFTVPLSPDPASCPKGIVYFEPHGLAILDAAANYFQWGTLDADFQFVPDSGRTEQTTFVPGLTACDSSLFVVRTSINGTQCWSTTVSCATPEMLARTCLVGEGMAEGPRIRLYPNPSSGGPVTLEAVGESGNLLNIDVSDLNGRILSRGALRMNGVSTMTLDLEPPAPGVYVLRAWNTDMDQTIKLVIE